MLVEIITMGEFRVNNYLVIDEKSKQAAIIDAGGDYQATIDAANKHGAQIKLVLNTHAHLDHIAGDYDLQTKTGAKVYLHKEDLALAEKLQEHLVMFGMPLCEIPKIDVLIEDGQVITLGDLEFKVIHTPGHTLGGVCYLIDNLLFSGDTLFAQSVGRTDLPGGSFTQLEKSIREKLYVLDEEIIVYPGHGYSSTIGNEKKNNPFVSG